MTHFTKARIAPAILLFFFSTTLVQIPAFNQSGAQVNSGNTKQTQLKWTAPEPMKAAINNTKSNIKNIMATLDELGLTLNKEKSNSKAINNSKSNLKNYRATLINLEQTLNMMEAKEKNIAMAELNDKTAAMNKQFLALQQSLNEAGRQYSTVSNVLKTKHDTAKNSIGNIR